MPSKACSTWPCGLRIKADTQRPGSRPSKNCVVSECSQPSRSGPATRTYQEHKLVEATGCNMPGEFAGVQSPVPLVIQAQPSASPQDPSVRLQQLDKLRASGAISEADYNRKRKEIIDSI